MIQSPLFLTLPQISHAFVTRADSPFPAVTARTVTAKQVHGTSPLFVTEVPKVRPHGYDILITGTYGISVAVETADCLPILLAEPEAGLVAAVHAGWRGTADRIAEKAVAQMVKRGASADRIVAALGPSIGGNCYEVEQDVASRFGDFPEALKRKSEKKWLLDLAEANRRQLICSGLSPERIDRIDLCTHCRPDLFHSYRRDGEKTGRMTSFIKLLPA